MVHDKKTIAVCGETELANAKQSLVTMMQASPPLCPLKQFDNKLTAFAIAGLRILYLSSPGEILRISVRLHYLSTWVFLHVPTENTRYPQASLHLE